MNQQSRIAVITVSREAYLRYCIVNQLSDQTAKQVSILRDIQGEEFSEKILIDGSHNVTNYVIDNLMIEGEDNSEKKVKLR
jgi:hypothetical protein